LPDGEQGSALPILLWARPEMRHEPAEGEGIYKLMMGREERILELKTEVNTLQEQLGKSKKYTA
jgi:hypothetical protein